MNTQSFEHLGSKVTEMIRAQDPRPLAELMSFPFTFIENEFTIVVNNPEELFNLHEAYAPAVRQVVTYAISDGSIQPVSSMLYVARFTVNVAFTSGVRLDPSKRVVMLGERDGETKALAGLALLECSTEWLKDNAPEKLEEVRSWAS